MDKSDEDWINLINMSKRYQYSKKTGDDIIVVEATDESWEDFMLDVKTAKAEFGTPNVPQPTTVTQNAQAPTPSEPCPTCGSALVIITTKTGKRVQKCSTNKWNPETKTAEGCSYVKWL